MMNIDHILQARTAPHILFDAIERYGDKPRFYIPEAVSWNQFGDKVRQLGMCLLSLGIRPGDTCAIYAHNSLEWASAALAVQSIGAVLVPIYPASTKAQCDYIVGHSDAKLIFDHEGLRRISDGKTLRWQEVAAYGQDRASEFDERLASIGLDDIALMLYTSGTTGVPKGVPLTHGNVGTNAVDWLRSNQPLLHEDAIDLLWLPMSHIFGFGELCLGNSLGFTSYIVTPAEVLDLMPTLKPTVFMSVPAYWEKLAGRARMHAKPVEELRRLTGGRLRFCLSGGAGLNREVKELYLEMGCLIVEGYGLTETAPTLTINRPNDYRLDSVGKALPSVQLRIAEDSEIQARGPNVFSGYYKDPVASAEAFTEDGWFKTGDLGSLDDDGFLRIIGRKKEILVTAGGKNIPPANIEMLFQDDPYMDHVVVYGDGKKYLVAGIWPNQSNIQAHLGSDASEQAVRKLLADRVEDVNGKLARFETIKNFAVMSSPLSVESELLTSSLKIRRKKIYEHHRDVFENLYSEPEKRA